MERITITGSAGRRMVVDQMGKGPAVLLLHGIPGSYASWMPVAECLVGQGIRVYIPHLLGFGRSSRHRLFSDLCIESQAEMIGQLLRVHDLRDVHLVGHDYGGPVAVHVASAIEPSRIRSLTLLSTNVFTDTPIPFPLTLVTKPWVGRAFAKLLFSRPSLQMMLQKGKGERNASIDVKNAIGDRAQARAIATIFYHSLTKLGEQYRKVEEALSSVRIPAQVIWGDRDPLFAVNQGQRLAATLPSAHFHLLKGAGHFLPEERSTEVVRLIQSHISREF